MPHITIKMLKGRTQEQKELASEMVANALYEAIGCTQSHISVSVEDYTPEEWQEVYANEVENNPKIIKNANYNPKDLLKK